MSGLTVRQLIAPDGNVVVMSNDMAIPPGYSVVGGSEQTVTVMLPFDVAGGLVMTGPNATLPTSDPGMVGHLWDNGGIVAVSAGSP